jgi:transcription elongation factor Elf1
MNLNEHKQDLINAFNCDECNTKNQLIALLEIKKYEIVKELLGDEK